MAELAAISQTKSVHRYSIDRTQNLKRSTGGGLLDNPPVVIPEEMPYQTMCRILGCCAADLAHHPDYDDLRSSLLSYQRGADKRGWDEFRQKMEVKLLAKFGDILIECRRNGFILPVADSERIRWHQVTGHGEPTRDLCTMCDRACLIREAIDTGRVKQRRMIDKGYKEKPKCWEVGKPEEVGA